MSKVKKAVIPAAGLGTRFLPATKTVPKEMLTIVDAPIIFYVVEEAIQAGVEDIILIQGRGKTAIEDFFDVSYELEDKLNKDGKTHLLERLRRIRQMANLISVRQKQPLGLGHAVLCAEKIVGNEPFAVLLGDEIMVSDDPAKNTTSVLCQANAELGSSVVAIMEVPAEDVSKYGIASLLEAAPNQAGCRRVHSFVEKPAMDKAPSRWALPGRYVFTHQLFSFLKNANPGVGGEIQLTDSMNELAKAAPVFATTFTADRFDAGDKLGYLQANVELALRNPELRDAFAKYLRQVVAR